VITLKRRIERAVIEMMVFICAEPVKSEFRKRGVEKSERR
jgi:hypothetical protein